MHTSPVLPFRLAALATLAACSSTGATFRSGVGDTFLEHPPYYAGARAAAADTGRAAHLPVAYQRGGAQAPMFDPREGAGTPVAALLADMSAFLDSLGVTARLEGAAPAPAGAVPPDVQFGCAPDAAAGGECAERGDSALGRKGQTMRLAVGRPSAEWAAWAGEGMGRAGAERLLVLTLEVGQYLPRQRGLRGDKEVELGTGHVVALPWLTSLETPVSVLQLTGALVGRDGKAVRIGAEGLHARRTRLGVSALGAQELLRDEDVEAVRAARRDDLPGRPLAWQAAMRTLVEGLMGR